MPLTPKPPAGWRTARGTISLDHPFIVGILNITPDSFSDGGRYLDPDAALGHAEHLIQQGADMLDVGAESTRPGRPDPVPPAEEWRRLEPALKEIFRRFPAVPLSVDTVKAETARRALDAGAWVINDVSGLRADPGIAEACARAGAGLILMHSRGSVQDMATYDHATYHDVPGEVARELSRAIETAEQRGVARDCLVIDPGLGFSKRPEHNFAVLKGLGTLTQLGPPVMVGPSRKRFLAAPIDRPVEERDPTTAAACVAACLLGASLFRVHNVQLTREALAVAHAIRTA
ncbi:MAG: dihydropteroate synthase [Gemmatimonadetes bacterium]|nr:dihydropteroate synthase [Gemmatimonadota bacterium]